MSTILGAIAFFAMMIAQVLAVIAVGRARADAGALGRPLAKQQPVRTDARSWHIWLHSS
jgi:hypothetical protein